MECKKKKTYRTKQVNIVRLADFYEKIIKTKKEEENGKRN